MKTYTIQIKEEHTCDFELEAENLEQAKELAQEKWEAQESVPRTELNDTDIEVIENES